MPKKRKAPKNGDKEPTPNFGEYPPDFFIQTNLDEYVYNDEDIVDAGTIERDRVYTEADFNRIIEMRPREAYRV
ncbi:MAG: hypothetical protein RIG66_03115 [Coleofasciculus sp. E2-BRE-01]